MQKNNSNNNNKKEEEGTTDFFEFSNHFVVGLTSLIFLVILVVFFICIVLYGTGCPNFTTKVISVKYGENEYTFTRFYCYNPIKWFNPKTSSESSNKTDPNDVFLGIFILPPGLTLMLGLVYTFFYALLHLLGLLAGLKNNLKMMRTFNLWALRAMWLNLFLLLANAFSWFFLIVREGQNDYANNPEWICAAFNDINWNICGFIAGNFVFFIAFFILSLVSYVFSSRSITPHAKKEEQQSLIQ